MTRPAPKPPAQRWPEDALTYTYDLRKECRSWRERVQILEARQAYVDADVERSGAEIACLRALVVKLGGDPSDAAQRTRPTLVSKGEQA
jgi:hypothetical protein